MKTYMIDYRDYSSPTMYKKFRISSFCVNARSASHAVATFRKINNSEVLAVLVPVGDLICGFAQCWDFTDEQWS